MKKLFFVAVIIGVLVMVFVCPWNVAKAEANDPEAGNNKKYFTSYVVEKGDTLWDIAQEYMTEEYDTAHVYIKEVMESNHLESTGIIEGQMLILPYYADKPIR
nr:LysM peptidoglycan-binding domain-containing protein [Frisingicoccus sp.]